MLDLSGGGQWKSNNHSSPMRRKFLWFVLWGLYTTANNPGEMGGGMRQLQLIVIGGNYSALLARLPVTPRTFCPPLGRRIYRSPSQNLPQLLRLDACERRTNEAFSLLRMPFRLVFLMSRSMAQGNELQRLQTRKQVVQGVDKEYHWRNQKCSTLPQMQGLYSEIRRVWSNVLPALSNPVLLSMRRAHCS